jgi:hypothetical protein
MRHRRWFLRLTILAIVLALAISTMLMQVLQISSVVAAQTIVNSYTPYLAGLRLMVIAVIAYAWPKLIQYGQHSGRVSKKRGSELESLRWRIVVWLLIIELLVGQNLIGRLLSAMDSAGA